MNSFNLYCVIENPILIPSSTVIIKAESGFAIDLNQSNVGAYDLLLDPHSPKCCLCIASNISGRVVQAYTGIDININFAQTIVDEWNNMKETQNCDDQLERAYAIEFRIANYFGTPARRRNNPVSFAVQCLPDPNH